MFPIAQSVRVPRNHNEKKGNTWARRREGSLYLMLWKAASLIASRILPFIVARLAIHDGENCHEF